VLLEPLVLLFDESLLCFELSALARWAGTEIQCYKHIKINFVKRRLLKSYSIQIKNFNFRGLPLLVGFEELDSAVAWAEIILFHYNCNSYPFTTELEARKNRETTTFKVVF